MSKTKRETGDFDPSVKRYLDFTLGVNAKYFKLIPPPDDIQDIILKVVRSQIGDCFSICFATDGLPLCFLERTFTPLLVVYSKPYILLTEKIRHLFNHYNEKGLTEIVQHIALRLIAEMSLKNDPDFAVLAFAKSMTHQRIFFADESKFEELEQMPKNETYMVCMFFSLLHELGHISDIQKPLDDNSLFTDKRILELTEYCISRMNYPTFVLDEAKVRATTVSESIMNINNLRREVRADAFAITTLVNVTSGFMNEQFDLKKLIFEVFLYSHSIGIIERCQNLSIASLAASTPINDEDDKEKAYQAGIEADLQPISILVRTLLQADLFIYNVVTMFYGNNPTAEEYSMITAEVQKIFSSVEEIVARLDDGLAIANKFCRFPDQREEELIILENYRRGFDGWIRYETEKFCNLANTLQKDSKLLQVLKSIIKNPNSKVQIS